MSSSIESPLNLGLFVFASFIYALTVSHAGLGSGKGGGSGALEQQLRKNEKLEKNASGTVTPPHLDEPALDRQGPNLDSLEGKNVVIFVMGVCGCGKSTVAIHLSQKLGIPYIDGDSLHSKENVEKMGNGQALTDEDRVPWLQKIHTTAQDELAAAPGGCIIAASSLKFPYREIQRGNELLAGLLPALPNGLPQSKSRKDVRTVFVYLKGERSVLLARMHGRKGHYMKEDMLDSQLNTLEEPPVKGEKGIVVVDIDADEEEVFRRAFAGVKKELGM